MKVCVLILTFELEQNDLYFQLSSLLQTLMNVPYLLHVVPMLYVLIPRAHLSANVSKDTEEMGSNAKVITVLYFFKMNYNDVYYIIQSPLVL